MAMAESLDETMAALIERFTKFGQTKSAVFWAEKRLALCNGDGIAETVSYLQTLTAAAEWDRILAFCERLSLASKHRVFRYFLANALYKLKMYESLIEMINSQRLDDDTWPSIRVADVDGASASSSQRLTEAEKSSIDDLATSFKTDSATQLLLGKSFLKLENRPEASNCFRECLTKDPTCLEALDLILSHNLYSNKELNTLLAHIPVETHCRADMTALVRHIYAVKARVGGAQVDGFDAEADFAPALSRDLSMRTCEAQRLYNTGDIRQAYRLSSTVLLEEGLYAECLPIHIVLLVELNKSNELFTLAHRLVDRRPDWALSWYAVGCYYFAINNLTTAKRFLGKSTGMNQSFGGGWILFGHVFAKEGEHDQAMNCYTKATRLLSGCYEPLLYIGMEYAFANNYQLANDFLKQSADIAGDDPRVLHEQGCLAFCLRKDYQEADQLFRKALRLVYGADENADVRSLIGRTLAESWEPLINNLGHVSRKLNKLDDAIAFHRKSLLLCPRRASTLSALGVAYVASGQLELGIDSLHQSLSLTPSDPVAKFLLKTALELIDKHPSVWSNGPTLTAAPKPRIEHEPITKVGRRTTRSSQRSSVLSAVNDTREKSLSGIEEIEMDMD